MRLFPQINFTRMQTKIVEIKRSLLSVVDFSPSPHRSFNLVCQQYVIIFDNPTGRVDAQTR
jgi:hypothetical protein